MLLREHPQLSRCKSYGDLLRTGDGLGTEALAQSPEIRRRITAQRKVGTEVDHRKYKDIGHSFGLGTGTSTERHVVDGIRFRKTISDRRLTDVYMVVEDIQSQLWVIFG
jgi:hypothetical protein